MNGVIPGILVLANTVTLMAGGFVTTMALRAFRRTGSPAMRALAIGLGLVTLGTLIGGGLHQLLEMEILMALTVQSLFTAVGFLVLVHSLYTSHAGMRVDTSTAK